MYNHTLCLHKIHKTGRNTFYTSNPFHTKKNYSTIYVNRLDNNNLHYTANNHNNELIMLVNIEMRYFVLNTKLNGNIYYTTNIFSDWIGIGEMCEDVFNEVAKILLADLYKLLHMSHDFILL